MALNRDFKDLLRALNGEGAEYLLIGAYAVAYYAEPRFTKDFDLWIASDAANVDRVWRALEKFGAPLDQIGKKDLMDPEAIYQIGIAPNRIDLVVDPGGPRFSEAWKRRTTADYDGEALPIVGLEDLIRLKKVSGRKQDLADLKSLRDSRRSKKK